MEFAFKGMDETIEYLQGVSARASALQPALEVFGESIVKQVDDCFANSVDWDGKAFDDLRPSTIEHRISKIAGTRNLRGKRAKLREKLAAEGRSKRYIAGRVTKHVHATLKKRTKAAFSNSALGITILVDTARARNSSHVGPAKATSIEWSAVGYLAYHMTGTKKGMPARNPTPWIWAQDRFELHPRAAKEFDALMQSYIRTGEPESGAA